MIVKAIKEYEFKDSSKENRKSIVKFGNEFEVYGVLFVKDDVFYLLEDGLFYLASLFEILNPQIPKYWAFSKFSKDEFYNVFKYEDYIVNGENFSGLFDWNLEASKELRNLRKNRYFTFNERRTDDFYGHYMKKLLSWKNNHKDINFKFSIQDKVSLEISNFTGKTNLDIANNKDKSWFSIEASKDKFSAYSSLDNLEIVLKCANEWVGI
ncbi:hypothetical protein CBLAS_1545 [Campylobacter blaseri]|uniref:Uncharacterized protein n=1 Tax=Campylobacter blaseri TaxID=2042961 RepID=A0A2P8QZE5_9BACT|nr:hypothetical protein [Campylobacter blaseri]PSM51616.1 hypothetical protein CQ405_07420 [Campylobacter blaseri]PSM53409.1 hypothetical protein CRN67_07425 [Campylobacter blaseri]QKF86706.1 hypothetical protein CBLAS_1545 [Campylobacter blaseri]